MLELEVGADALLVYGEDYLNDTRCATCGLLLFSVVREGTYVPCCAGLTRRSAEHSTGGAHLRRVKGAMVRDPDDLPQAEEYE
jgi:hypothetical protein